MRSNTGVLRLALAFTALLVALTVVVKRQTHALEVLRGLDQARTTRAIAEARRAELHRQIEFLESRARVVAEATTRLGMHVPSSDEMVFLPMGERPANTGSAVASARPRATGASQP